MKSILTICVAVMLTLGVSAQSVTKYSVTGYAFDSLKNEAIPYATAVLLDNASKPISSAYTDDKGKFTLKAPKGNYKIKVIYVGYAPYEKDVEVVGNVDLGAVSVAQGIQIEAATVYGQLVTTDIDKTTYNTAVDPEAPSLTALEMMRKVPMLSVDGEDNLKLKGGSNFKILVNGKSSSLMSNNYKDVLKSMPASSIKNIEVITNPPAKYDAEGIGGIINIITNRKVADGFSGSVWASGGTKGDYNLGTYMAGTTGKFNVSGNLYFGRYNNPANQLTVSRENYNADFGRYQQYTSSQTYSGYYEGLSVEMSYEFDSLNLLSFSVNGNLGQSSNISNAFFELFNAPFNVDRVSAYKNNSSGTGSWGGVGASLDYQRSFKKKDQMLTASYKLDYNPDNNSYENYIEGIQTTPSSASRSNSTAWGMEHAFQVDYFDPINEHHQIETGIKYTFRPSMSNSFNETLNGDVWEPNLAMKNDLDYWQHIGSAYFAYQYKIKKFSVKVGARAEYTVNTGRFKQAVESSLFARYFNVVPHLTLGLKIDDAQSLRLGYTQRLSRPGIWYLNPYINDEEPMNISTGNPNLLPELTHSFDLSYGIYKPAFNINASLSAMLTDNSIERVGTINPTTGAMLTRPENIGIKNSYIASISAGLRFWDSKLSININADGGYVTVKANNGTGAQNQGWQGSAFMQVTGQTWKNGQVSVMGGFGLNEISLQNREQFYYFSSVSVAQTFLDKKLRLQLSAQNPWTKYQFYTMTSGDANFHQDVAQRNSNQSLRLSISWRFGKASGGVKKAARSIDSDDIKGGGSKGGSQGGGNGGGGQ